MSFPKPSLHHHKKKQPNSQICAYTLIQGRRKELENESQRLCNRPNRVHKFPRGVGIMLESCLQQAERKVHFYPAENSPDKRVLPLRVYDPDLSVLSPDDFYGIIDVFKCDKCLIFFKLVKNMQLISILLYKMTLEIYQLFLAHLCINTCITNHNKNYSLTESDINFRSTWKTIRKKLLMRLNCLNTCSFR